MIKGGETILGDLLARVSEAGRMFGAPRAKATLEERCVALLDGAGEATGLVAARDILDRYAALDETGKRGFFEMVATRFGVDEAALTAALEAWRSGAAHDARVVHVAAEPRSQQLIRLLNRAPGAAVDLVGMRADLLRMLPEAPTLAGLDEDFRHLFASWFNRGFLSLRRLDWTAPANVLEKIIQYEAVHEIADWDDLRRRVGAPDRRLYGFFHPALGDEPLIFVEVALTDAIPDAIGPILAEERAPIAAKDARTAVFYSISNCQAGLRGVSFGNFLIKQVVEELRAELPEIRNFVTLSPAPRLRGWALGEAEKGAEGLLSKPLREAVAALQAGDKAEPALQAELAATYFLRAKDKAGRPVDPVARFHLGNGARLERVNPGADKGARARAEAWGVMVNYLYDLASIEKNHEAFAARGEIDASSGVRRLVRGRRKEASPDAGKVDA